MKKHQRIWSRKILKVVKVYNSNRNLFLFGITGDIDNLGIFVSQHGRPLAENLVDIYNRLIGAFMYKFVKKHSKIIFNFCMIPAGEEIFAIGVTNDPAVVNKFFSLLENEINNFIKENAPFSDENVTISFGCKIFSDDITRISASHFVNLVSKRKTLKASLAYLKFMLILRQELAYELDRAKFRSLKASNLNLVIFFRNVVYAKLQNYKVETRKNLIALADQMNCNAELRKRLQSMTLNSKYGITDENAHFIKKLIEKKKGE